MVDTFNIPGHVVESEKFVFTLLHHFFPFTQITAFFRTWANFDTFASLGEQNKQRAPPVKEMKQNILLTNGLYFLCYLARRPIN